MNVSIKEYKKKIVEAGERAIEQLIKVAKEDINFQDGDKDVEANEIKFAAQSKKLAIFDALEILAKIEMVQDELDDDSVKADGGTGTRRHKNAAGGFAEGKAKGQKPVPGGK